MFYVSKNLLKNIENLSNLNLKIIFCCKKSYLTLEVVFWVVLLVHFVAFTAVAASLVAFAEAIKFEEFWLISNGRLVVVVLDGTGLAKEVEFCMLSK